MKVRYWVCLTVACLAIGSVAVSFMRGAESDPTEFEMRRELLARTVAVEAELRAERSDSGVVSFKDGDWQQLSDAEGRPYFAQEVHVRFHREYKLVPRISAALVSPIAAGLLIVESPEWAPCTAKGVDFQVMTKAN